MFVVGNGGMRQQDAQNVRVETSWLRNSIGTVLFAIKQSAADDYGIKMSLLFLLLNRLEDNPQAVAANSLVVMLSNVLVITGYTPHFSINSQTVH